MQTFTTSDGVKIAYTIDDYADPWKPTNTLVMLHPAMSSSKRFYSLVPGLARHYRVVRLDTRGHGQSEVPGPDTVMNKARVMQDVVEALDHLKLDKVHLFAASAGGYSGQQMAIHRPERVRSLMVYCSTPGLKGASAQAKTWLREAAARGMRPVFGETINDRLPVGKCDQRLIDWVLNEICKNDINWLARFIGYWADTDFMDEISAIKCPTLIVAPGDEPIGGTSGYDEMKQRIKDSELIIYEGARHNIYDYMPDRCVNDALAFLKKRFPGDFA